MAELAARQHGVVSLAQLLALGVGAGAIKYRLKVGRLHLLHRDATTHYGIRVTAPARTLVDVLPERALPEPSTKPKSSGSPRPKSSPTLFTRYPGRRTASITPERGATRSHLEDDFTRFLKRHRLVIELDSRQFHTTPSAFERDRDRDADLLNAGFSALRITDHRLKEQQAKEAQRLKEILRSRTP